MVRLGHEAKDLLRLHRVGDPDALRRFRQAHPRFDQSGASDRYRLSDAQLVLVREYGLAAWPKLKHHVEGLQTVEERVAWLRQAFAAADQDTPNGSPTIRSR
jgi:hypothetical protein